jgi:hypothetical protein
MDHSGPPVELESLPEEAPHNQPSLMRPNLSDEKSSATVNRCEKFPHVLPRLSVCPQGTKDEAWPQSTFHCQRSKLLDQIKWSVDAEGNPGRRNYARAYEFRWSDISGQQQCDMCEFSQTDGSVNDATFEADIKQWIAESRHQEAVTIRLFVTYLVDKRPKYGLPIARGACEAIEEDFGLHPATAQTLCYSEQLSGLEFSCSSQQEPCSSTDGNAWLVTYFEPIIRDRRWTMSLRHDYQRQHTDAILFISQDGEEVFDQVLNEFLILHKSWKEFRILPEAFLQIYLQNLLIEVGKARSTLRTTESRLGATRNWEKDNPFLDDWPQNVDGRENTASLHDTLYRLARQRSKLQKAKRLRQTIAEMEARLRSTQSAVLRTSSDASELDQYSIWTDTLLQQADMKIQETQERAEIQADLLASIVSQQASHESNSGKYISISSFA